MVVLPVLWNRIDLPGHETARLRNRAPGWLLEGSAVFIHDRRPCRLDYRVACSSKWHTLSASVTGWVGSQTIKIRIRVDQAGRWSLNDQEIAEVAGCLDVDFAFSPSTNLLPIRRLSLAVGQEAGVRAAWLRFPGFTLEPLEQRYHRTGETAYRYLSQGGSFVRDLQVSQAGFVLNYPGFWQAEAGTRD